jgi:hypothetical protein
MIVKELYKAVLFNIPNWNFDGREKIHIDYEQIDKINIKKQS